MSNKIRPINIDAKRFKSLVEGITHTEKGEVPILPEDSRVEVKAKIPMSKSYRKRINELAGITELEDIHEGTFKVKVKHDSGVSTIKTAASDAATAKSNVAKAENCPPSAILSVKEVVDEATLVRPRPNLSIADIMRVKLQIPK